MSGLVKSAFVGTCLLAACATPEAAARVDVQVAAEEFPDTWPPPLPHHPRIAKARVGEVVVPGIWTVLFEFAPEDAAWFADLGKQHRHVRLTMAGYELLTDGRTGYVKGMHGRSDAEALLARLGTGGH